jgi:hypothetical protein
MAFLKRVLGGGGRVAGPSWAAPMSDAEAAALLEAVGRDMDGRGLVFETGDGFVRVNRGDGPHDYGLTNLAQICHGTARTAWAEQIGNHFDLLIAAEDAAAQLDSQAQNFEAVRSILKVRLYPPGYLGGIDPQRPASWQVAPGLVAAFVYDLPTSVSSVDPEHVAGWGLSHDELLAVAMENVRSDDVEAERIADDGPSSTIGCFADHFFAASHALLLDERLPPQAEFGAVFGVPQRHALLYAPILDVGIVPSINRLIVTSASLFNQGPGSITQSVYWWRQGSVILLPAEFDGRNVAFAPPEEFVDVLNRLGTAPG